MKRIIEFITDVMRRYSESVESLLEDIVKYGKWLITGLFVVIGYLLLAVTMPVWYLPYKYFNKKWKV